jgi:hypothetical protein
LIEAPPSSLTAPFLDLLIPPPILIRHDHSVTAKSRTFSGIKIFSRGMRVIPDPLPDFPRALRAHRLPLQLSFKRLARLILSIPNRADFAAFPTLDPPAFSPFKVHL